MKKKILWVILAVVVAFGGYYGWQFWGQYKQYSYFQNLEKNYFRAMKGDTYGGKTPQETLDLFVAALKAGDADLAAKYFALDDNLSRQKWMDRLNDLKARGLLDDMAVDIERNEFYKDTESGAKQFLIYNSDRTDSLIISLILNAYSGVWKIESI